jgi:hypothetical protein
VIIYRNSIAELQSEVLKAHPELESVDVLEDRGLWRHPSLKLEMMFHDGRRLMVERVDKQQSGNIALNGIGDYRVHVYIRGENEYHPGEKRYLFNDILYIDFLQTRLDVKLTSVSDIIKNYDVILSYIDALDSYTVLDNLCEINVNRVRAVWSSRRFDDKITYFNDREYLVFKGLYPKMPTN